MKTSVYKHFKLFNLLLVFFSSQIACFAVNAPRDEAENRVSEGNSLYLQKDYNGARQKYLVAIGTDSTYDVAHTNLGLTYAKLADFVNAVASVNEAIRLNSSEKRHFLNLGKIYAMNEQYDLAISAFTDAIGKDATYKEALYNRGWCYDAQGDYDLAIADYDEALKKDKNYSKAAMGMSISKAKKGLAFEAAWFCKRSLASSSGNADNLNVIRQNLRNLRGRNYQFNNESSIQLFKNGLSFLSRERTDEAEASFAQLVAAENQSALAHYMYSRALRANMTSNPNPDTEYAAALNLLPQTTISSTPSGCNLWLDFYSNSATPDSQRLFPALYDVVLKSSYFYLTDKATVTAGGNSFSYSMSNSPLDIRRIVETGTNPVSNYISPGQNSKIKFSQLMKALKLLEFGIVKNSELQENNADIKNIDGFFSGDETSLSGILATSNANISVSKSTASGDQYFEFTSLPQLAGNQTVDFTVSWSATSSFSGTFTFSVDFRPEMNVKGNGVIIADNDSTPDVLDGTDFGSAAANSGTIVKTFTIENLGSGSLNLTGSPIVAVSGLNASEFTVSALPATPLVSGSSTTFQVTFAPMGYGISSAMLSIANNDSNENPYNFSIQGRGTNTPEIKVTDQSGNHEIADGDISPSATDGTDFGSAEINTGTVLKTFKIYNLGDAPLNLNGNPLIEILGANAADFTVVTPPPSQIATNASATFTIQFDPSVSGLRTATLSIQNNDINENPYDFVIQGTGITLPEINVKGNGVTIANGDNTPNVSDNTDFGSLAANSGTVVKTFTIENLGSADLNLTGTPIIEFSGVNASEFTVSALPATTVISGANTTFQVTFSPMGYGIRSAALSIANNDSNENPYNFSIQGRGINTPEIKVTDQSGRYEISDGDISPSATDGTDFGSAEINFVTVLKTFKIWNLGDSPLLLSGSPIIGIFGENSADFTVATPPPSQIAANSSATFTVKFDPSVSGLRTATVSIMNNDINENPYDFVIQGTGITLPEINVKGNGVTIADGDNTPIVSDNTDFGSLSANSGTVVKTFTVENLGSADLNLTGTPIVEFLGVNASEFTLSALPATTVIPGANTTFQVTFAPMGYGIRSATLSIANNDGNENPYNFSIQGRGTNTPEIKVTDQFGSYEISDGDISPSATDGTDFGSAEINTGTVLKTFRIYNLGDAPLNLNGNPLITILGANAADFTVIAPPPIQIAANASATFTVQFDPSVSGLRTATLSIPNNDIDENPYNFAIQGTGALLPEMNVKGNGVTIVNGDVTPSVADFTNMGVLPDGSTGTIVKEFIIENLGSSDLNLTGTPIVSIGGPNATDFSVSALPGSPISTLSSTTFTITFTPGGAGLRIATISIPSNDSARNPYTFNVCGSFEGLIAYFPFNGNAVDESGKGNNGTVTGATMAPDRFLKPEKSYSFDGVDDDFSFGSNGRPFDNFSFGGWVKTDKTITLFAQSNSGTQGVSGQNYAFEPLNLGNADSGAGLSVGTNGIQVFERAVSYMPPLAVYQSSIGTDWNYIFVVYQNKRPTIYLNGTAVVTGLASTKNVWASNKGPSSTSLGKFKGSLDDLRVYDRPLSDFEVLKIYELERGHRVQFISGVNGSISGQLTQFVEDGGASIGITAVPNSGYDFSDWTGDYSGTENPLTLSNVTADMTINANFSVKVVQIVTDVVSLSVNEGSMNVLKVKLSMQPLTTKTVTVSRVSGDTDITASSGTSLNFTTLNWGTYQTVMIAAAEDNNDNINGSAVIRCSSPGMRDRNVTVNEVDDDFTLTVNTANGAVTRNPNTSYYDSGSTVQLKPVPNDGYSFTGWTGSLTGSADPAALIMNTNKTVTANFTANNVQIATNVTSVTVNEGSTAAFSVKLSAQPASDKTVTVSKVSGDSGITVSAGSSLTFTTTNWNTYQTVTLAAAEDEDNVNGSAVIRCISPGMTDKDVTANEADDDYMLTINATNGSVTRNPETTYYDNGTTVQLKPVPNDGYSFTGWTGSLTGSGNPATLLMDSNRTVTANFTINNVQITTEVASVSVNEGSTGTFNVKLSAQPTGGKTVTVSRVSGDGDITVSSGSSLAFTPSNWDTYQTVTLAAAEDVDLANSTAGIRCSSFGMADKTLIATEADNDTTLTVRDNGYGTTIPTGAIIVTKDAAAPISATATTGYHFVAWTVPAGSATFADASSANTSARISAPSTIRADFAINTYTLEYAAGANGAITGTASQLVDHGANGIEVTAVHGAGYHFVNWSDGSIMNPRTDTNVTADIAVTASFAHDIAALNMVVLGNGSTSPGIGTHTVNTAAVTGISASPGPGYSFINWSLTGNGTITDPSAADTSVTLMGNSTVTAKFISGSMSTLTDNAPVIVAGDKRTMQNFKITAPPGKTLLHATTSGGSGDCDLYVKFNDYPTVNDYYMKSTNSGNEEDIRIYNPSSGTWYVNLYGYEDFRDVELNVTFEDAALGKPVLTVTPLSDKVRLDWTAATGSPDAYEIYRADIDDIGMAAKIAEVKSSDTLHYENAFSPGTGNYDYYYWSRGVKKDALNNNTEEGGFSNSGHGSTNDGKVTDLVNGKEITPITGTTGSIQAFKINVPTGQTLLEVKINGSVGDCDFDVMQPNLTTVRRSVSGASNEIVRITGNPLASGDWFIHLYGQTEYSGLRLIAKYSNFTAAPAAPVVSATDGIYEDRVVVTWKAVATASSYEVYRNTGNATSGDNFRKLGESMDCIFEDNTAEYGTTYFYFAKAKNSMGASVKFSTGDSGYVAKTPAVPGTVTASDGTYFDKIRVSWAKVAGASSYLVFRTEATAPAPNPDLVDPIGETGALFLDDFGDDLLPKVEGVVKKYYYWIAAKNANATTALSKPNDGYLSNKGPATVIASNGTYSNRIVVTWAAVPGATAYDVYSYTDGKYTLNKTKVGDTVEALEHECIPITTDTPFYYKVNAKYAPGSYDSALSLTGALGKAAGASNPVATAIANGATSAYIVDKDKGSSIYYSIDVPAGTARLIATLAGTPAPVGKTNDCDLFAKFANYPTPSSYNAKGVENKDNEILTVSNPAAGTWYFMLYGTTAYTNVRLTVNCYVVADIVLTQVPVNDLAVPFTAAFKGKVLDDNSVGIPNIVLQVRDPITGLTSSLAKTDKSGIFNCATTISTEGEHTFDFFFTDMPDLAKGTASHTVATRKGCLVEAPNNFFDVSAYLQAKPVSIPLHADVVSLQDFLNTRNGWNHNPIDSDSETMWINSTLVKAGDDTQLASKLDAGLYLILYGVEGSGVGNDTTTTPAFSAVPFVVHVETSRRDTVLTALNTLGVIDGTQKAAIEAGSIGIVAAATLSVPDEGLTPKSISLLACEQLEILAILAGWNKADTGVTDVKYSQVTAKQIVITLTSGRRINVVAAGFVK